jgi:transposase
LNQGKAQGLDLGVVVQDAALGIAAGVREVFPDAQQRDDCFHVLYEMSKVRRRLERGRCQSQTVAYPG